MLEPDGADEQAHALLLLGEDMLDTGGHLRFRRVAPGQWRRHRLAFRLPVVNAAAPAMLRQEFLVGRRTIDRVRPVRADSAYAAARSI